MNKLFLLSLTAMLFASTAGAEVTTNVRIPLNTLAFVSCAAGGAGELVAISGDLHIVFTSTFSASGEVTSMSHFQPQGVSGFGLITGDKYQGTGVTQTTYHVDGRDGFPWNLTEINNFRIIGQGPGNNADVHSTLHITVNADGTATVTLIDSKVTCS